MFIDIDYSRKAKEAKFHLAKPNKQIVDIIHESFNGEVNLKLGDINEISFSIPHQIVDDKTGKLVKNKHIDTVREKMLIRLTMGHYQEWYIIDSIEEDGDDTDIFNVKAFSLGYELRDRKSPPVDPDEDVWNASEILNEVLKETLWSVERVAPTFDALYRSFDFSTSSNVLESVIEVVETFGALIEWDTENRKISLNDMSEEGRFRGMTVNYGRLLRSIKRTRSTDEMVTRMYIEGADGLTIHSVNPTGQGYIEDFSFFMYPFARDDAHNVLMSSYYMSDDLCHALINHKEALEWKSPTIISLQSRLGNLEKELIEKSTELEQARLDLEKIIALLDVAKATDDEELTEKREKEKSDKESEIRTLESEVSTLRSGMTELTLRIDKLHREIEIESGFTPELLDELSLYIIERDWKDDRYIEANELYNDGLKKFEKLRQPKIVLDVSIDNLLNIVEEQYYWDKLVLGDMIKVKYPQMDLEYMASIIEINFDLAEGEANLVVANTKDLLNDTERLIELLYSNSSASTLIEENKSSWDKIVNVEDEVIDLITQEWDANKQRIVAGVNNSVEIGHRGILIKDPDFPNEMVIMQAGIIALTEDGGETWKTAIKPSGVVAERLTGKIIAGQELVITNGAGSFTMDSDGFRVRGADFVVENSTGDKNLVEDWNRTGDFVDDFRDDGNITDYEKGRLLEQWEEYNAQYNLLNELISGYFDDGESTPEVEHLHEMYQGLYDHLFVDNQEDGYPLLSSENRHNTTEIDKNIFKKKWNDYRDAVPAVQNMIQLRSKEIAEEARADAESARKGIEEVRNNTIWKIEIESSNGIAFRHGGIETTLTATVYKGNENVTDTLNRGNFIWTKALSNGELDEDWNKSHQNVGNVVYITDKDVQQRATFKCDIFIKETEGDGDKGGKDNE